MAGVAVAALLASGAAMAIGATAPAHGGPAHSTPADGTPTGGPKHDQTGRLPALPHAHEASRP